jgi:hypothetical protein
MPIVHQGMAGKAQPSFLAQRLAQQLRLRIRGARVRIIATIAIAAPSGVAKPISNKAEMTLTAKKRTPPGLKAPSTTGCQRLMVTPSLSGDRAIPGMPAGDLVKSLGISIGYKT